MTMNPSVRSSAIAGVSALIIYFIIALATGSSVPSALILGLLLGLFTMAISFAIYKVIGARKR